MPALLMKARSSVGYDCMDAGGRAMQEQLPRAPQEVGDSQELQFKYI